MSRETEEREIQLAAQFTQQRLNVTGLTPTLEQRAFLALLADRDRLAAELARVRNAAMLLLAEAEDVMDRYESRCPLQAGELQRAIDEIRSALAQPQDGTTEGEV